MYAYAELPEAARRELIRVTVQDATDPLVTLAAFLSVEEAPTIRVRLEGLLAKHGRVERRAWTWGTPDDGGAALTQMVGARPPDTLELRWNDSEISEIRIETTAEPSFPVGAQSRTPAEVIELIAPRLWTYLRDGHPVPTGTDRFVGFFSLR